MHSGEKSYKCNQCGFASFYESALKKHLKKKNTVEKTCNQCTMRKAMKIKEIKVPKSKDLFHAHFSAKM